MNWVATVNDELQDFPVVSVHLFMSENCEYAGLCAKLEASAALSEAIEGFLEQIRCRCRSWRDSSSCLLHRTRPRITPGVHNW